MLYLKHSHRGRGLGRALLELIEEDCASRRIRTLWLTVNKDNVGPIAFYERSGFLIDDAMVTDIGNGFAMDDYQMVKQLG